MTEELDWGLPRDNSSLVARAGLEAVIFGFQARRPTTRLRWLRLAITFQSLRCVSTSMAWREKI